MLLAGRHASSWAANPDGFPGLAGSAGASSARRMPPLSQKYRAGLKAPHFTHRDVSGRCRQAVDLGGQKSGASKVECSFLYTCS